MFLLSASSVFLSALSLVLGSRAKSITFPSLPLTEIVFESVFTSTSSPAMVFDLNGLPSEPVCSVYVRGFGVFGLFGGGDIRCAEARLESRAIDAATITKMDHFFLSISFFLFMANPFVGYLTGPEMKSNLRLARNLELCSLNFQLGNGSR